MLGNNFDDNSKYRCFSAPPPFHGIADKRHNLVNTVSIFLVSLFGGDKSKNLYSSYPAVNIEIIHILPNPPSLSREKAKSYSGTANWIKIPLERKKKMYLTTLRIKK